jgi:hypothetical protein
MESGFARQISAKAVTIRSVFSSAQPGAKAATQRSNAIPIRNDIIVISLFRRRSDPVLAV